MSPFKCAFGDFEEVEVAVPSIQDHLRRCHRTWKKLPKLAQVALLRASTRPQLQTNHCHISAPVYTPGQTVWLMSSKDLPLKVESKKLAPRFIGPFEIESIINPSAVRLKRPASLRIHPTFHVSLIKPVCSSSLSFFPFQLQRLHRPG